LNRFETIENQGDEHNYYRYDNNYNKNGCHAKGDPQLPVAFQLFEQIKVPFKAPVMAVVVIPVSTVTAVIVVMPVSFVLEKII
jgi:hypothetical protein